MMEFFNQFLNFLQYVHVIQIVDSSISFMF